MTNYKKLAKNSLIVLFSNFTVLGLNFFFVYLAIRFSGLYLYGVFTLLLAILGFVEQFITMGIYSVMVSEIARSIGQKNIPEAKSLLYRFAQTQFALSAVSAIVFFAAAYFNFFQLVPDYQNAIYAFALYLLFDFPKIVLLVAFESHQRFDLSARFLIVEAIARLVVLAVLFFGGFSGTVFGLALATLIGIVIGTISILMPFISLIKPWLLIPRKKTNLFSVLIKKQGIFSFLSNFIKNIQLNLYPWIINFFLGIETVAVFTVLQKLQGAVMKVIQPLDTTLLPLVSEMQKEEVHSFYNRISKYSFWISIATFFIVSISIPFFLTAYIGQPFPGQEIAMVLLLSCLPFYSLTVPIRSVLFRFREQNSLTKFQFQSMLVLFIATWIFASLFGLVGAAFATMVFYVFDLLIRKRFVAKKYKVDFSIQSFFSFDSQDKVFVEKALERIRNSFFKR